MHHPLGSFSIVVHAHAHGHRVPVPGDASGVAPLGEAAAAASTTSTEEASVATIWRGSVAFGLVNIPVELQPAVRDHRLSFRMLHGKDNTPIRFERVRADNGKPVPWKEIVKGYPLPDGDFVVLTDADFNEAAVEQNKMLDILDFVDRNEIDPRFFESSYFIVPSKGGEHAYALLRDAMRTTNTVGIGKIIIHRAQHLAAIRVLGDALELVLMRFAHELINPGEYAFPTELKARPEELKMAVQLVDNFKASFDSSKYTDEYNENLLRIINAKAKGRSVSLVPPARAAAEPKVLDLMARLQESLAQAKRGVERTRPTRSRRGRVERATEGAEPGPARGTRRRRSA
jgi:DNA end-binding protein Ku